MSGETTWTRDQELAINLKGCNVLVSAAAGSGKTSVLVERVIRLILDETSPVDVEKLVIVTFTEKAAMEMKARLRAALERKLDQNPNDQRIKRQLGFIERAQISTIHSFCLNVIRRYFYVAGLDPSFRVLDEYESELLRLDALGEVLEEFAAGQGEFYDLLDRYGGADGYREISSFLLALHKFLQTQVDPDKWLSESVESFKEYLTPERVLYAPWASIALVWCSKETQYAKELYESALELCNLEGGPAHYTEVIAEELEIARSIQKMLEEAVRLEDGRAQVLAKVSELLNTQRRSLPRKKFEGDEKLKEKVKDIREKAWDLLCKVAESPVFREPDTICREMAETQKYALLLANLVRELDRRHVEMKRNRNGLDFADLERVCLSILQANGEEVAKELRAEYEFILVDEYQDTNPVQDKIISLVSRSSPGNLFMVGDIKQSIYRFRLAEPRIFLEKYTSYERVEREDPEMSAAGLLVCLSRNFRSRPEIIHLVNRVFGKVMTKEAGEIDYGDDHKLVSGLDWPDSLEKVLPEFHLVERNDRTEENPDDAPAADDLSEYEAIEKEAMVVASEIKKLVGGEPGKFAYRDIVVLMRATRERANAVLEVFRRFDIPSYCDLGTGYFRAHEVEVMVSLLSVIDNPLQDIPLASVLRSPIVGLGFDELAKVRATCPSGLFFDSVRSYTRREPQDVEEEGIRNALEEFLKKLDDWRTLARRSPVSELIWRLYRDTGYCDYVGGLPGGAQRQANLRAFADRAAQFDSFGRHGLFQFLRFIERIREAQGDMGAARALGEQENVVRILSIHKAKGLEFPVVFLMDAGRRFGSREGYSDILFHRDLGIAPKYVDVDLRLKYPTPAYWAAKKLSDAQDLAEEMRILYVALTRAKQKLYIVGSARNLEKELERWKMGVPPEQARSYLDWLGPCLIREENEQFAKVFYWNTPGGNGIPRPPEAHLNLVGLYEAVKQQKALPVPSNPELYAEVKRRLEWKYPYEKLTSLRAKLSVGEFRDWLESEEGTAKISSGVSRSAAALRGTLIHERLANLDLEEMAHAQSLPEYLNGRLRDALGPEDIRAISDFFARPLGVNILSNPGAVRREIPFTLGLKASSVYGTDSDDDFVVVQGVIDLLLEEDDGLTILDYKTDKVDLSSAFERAKSYTAQVALYSLAAESITGKPVKKAVISMLTAGTEVDIDWQAFIRERGLQDAVLLSREEPSVSELA